MVPEPNTGCWLWLGHIRANGYPSFSICQPPKWSALAHRWAYEHFVGPIPEGFEVDHLCRVTICVNPGHLETVTKQVNLKRAWLARRAG